MKTRAIKIFALILTLVMLISAVPVGAFAQTENTNGDYVIEKVMIKDKTAAVSVSVVDECKAVVAIYDEATEQMLASGVANVTRPEEAVENNDAFTATVNVDIDIDTMPESYLIKAFLLDKNNAPCSAPFSFTYSNEGGIGSDDTVFTGTEATGTIINFGSYPQSKVNDKNLIKKLEIQSKLWKSYEYYSGTGRLSDGKMMPSDYMVFADFIYEGDKYRAVTFSKYRPYVTGYTSSASNTDQDDNGYTVDNVYYFKYEPLRWRVLDAGEGLVMSENIIDSQAFQNYVLYASSKYWGDSDKTYYASNWANSSIRQWLNNDFKNTAFNASQQKKIVPVTLDNSSQLDSTYNSASTTDKVFLLSYSEVKNTRYGFASSALTNDINRRAHSTDYAKCQGCRTETHSPYLTADGEDTSYWRLRSPYYSYYYTNEVDNSGYANNYSSVDGTGIGVRPALRLAPSANSKSSAPSKKAPAKSAVGTEAKTMYSNYSSGIAGNDYILLNVTGYGEGFTLTSENLLYIDQLTADSSGSLEIKFTPKYNDPDSTTLLIGDFGSGVETKILTVSEVKKYSVTWIIDGVQTVEYLAKGEPIYAPMAPEKEGYTFVGWTPGMPKSMPGMDLTFTAVYEKDPEPQGSVKGVKLDDISLNYLGKATLKPQITADEGVKYTVKYESSNPKVATVDDNGNVTATKKGTAEIRVTVTDENNNTVTNTCKVTVKYSGLQWFIIIVLFGWIWYLK